MLPLLLLEDPIKAPTQGGVRSQTTDNGAPQVTLSFAHFRQGRRHGSSESDATTSLLAVVYIFLALSQE
jgi:hypothetical protein